MPLNCLLCGKAILILFTMFRIGVFYDSKWKPSLEQLVEQRRVIRASALPTSKGSSENVMEDILIPTIDWPLVC